jgi:hypothetical protein
MSRRLLVLGLVLAACATVVTPAAAANEPSFEVNVTEPEVQPGAQQVVTVQLTNDAGAVDEAVKSAHAVEVEPTTGSTPFDVNAGPRLVGTMRDGEPLTVSFGIEVPSDTAPGTYAIPLNVSYEYDGDERNSTFVDAMVRVPERPRFGVRSVSSDLVANETGAIHLELANVGSQTAADTTVRLRAETPELSVGGSRATTVPVGSWAGGQTKNVTVPATTTDLTVQHDLAVTVVPHYEDEIGREVRGTPLSVGVRPSPAQTFDYRDIAVTLRGATARVTGTVVNTGSAPVTAALLRSTSSSATVRVSDGTYPVGTLGPGDAAPFAVDLRVAPNAHPGPRQLRLAVQYERSDDRLYRSDSTGVQVPLRTDQDVFEVETVNSTLGIDESNTVRVRVRNLGSEPLGDVRASLGLRPPYESNAPRASVAGLAPGESTILTFEITTPEDGVPTTDSFPLNVSATTPADRRLRFGPYYAQVTLTQPDRGVGGIPVIAIAGVVVVLLVGVGWWVFNR